jgi:glycosyltransferase involved in cell wall biosynthesis
MKYPQVLFFRNEKYSYIDDFFSDKSKLEFTLEIIGEKDKLNKLFDSNYQILVTFGSSDQEYIDDVFSIIDGNICNRWFHLNNIRNINEFNSSVNYCFISNAISERESIRPKFSVFTSCYNTYDKINRVYSGLDLQTCKSWEWVIMDDSPDLDDRHFNFLREKFKYDRRVRLYRRSENNGSIGNVKNECVSLCRGKYVLELDHDDVILPDVLSDAIKVFEQDGNEEIGFVYMDFINIYEDGRNFSYGDFICKGYGGYYCQKLDYIDFSEINGGSNWVNIYNTPNINNITLSHLVCMPNHPRIWKREILLEIGNYCELLPVCDDYEVLLKTAIHPKIKMAKLAKLGYIQYMNNGNNNFSLIRNQEINRIGPTHIMPQFFAKYKVHEVMKTLDSEEDHSYMWYHNKIWERNPETYQHKFCNKLVNLDFDKQYCILGINALNQHLEQIQELYKEPRNDFIVLDNSCSPEQLCNILDKDFPIFSRMKCYSMTDANWEKLERFFLLIYKSCTQFEVLREKPRESYMLPFNTDLSDRHNIINSCTTPENIYLEIGIEYGYTFKNVHFERDNKVGVDPDPKFYYTPEDNIFKQTSDEYFKECDDEFDVVFIDGMHQCEYVLRDFNNAIKQLRTTGNKQILIDDILPQNCREQLKVPIKNNVENGILKYGEPWTGDVWKTVYYLLNHCSSHFEFKYWNHRYYRGIALFHIVENFQIPDDEETIRKINSYTYTYDFSKYLEQLLSNSNS